VPIVYVPDHYGNANGAVSFTPGTSPTLASYLEVAGGGGLNNLQTGTISFWAQ
jgi:hypothetical protein